VCLYVCFMDDMYCVGVFYGVCVWCEIHKLSIKVKKQNKKWLYVKHN